MSSFGKVSRYTVVTLLLTLIASTAGAWQTSPARAWHAESLVIANTETSTRYVARATADGTYVLWESGGTSVHSHCKDIFVAELADRQPVLVARINDLGDAALDNGRVVWGSPELACDDQGIEVISPGLYLTDLATGEETTLIPDAEPVAVAIEGNRVAWVSQEAVESGRVRHQLFVGQIGSPDNAQEIAISEPGDGLLGDLRFTGDWLYWLRYGTDGSPNALYRFQVGSETMSDPEPVQTVVAPIIAHDVAGQMLVTVESIGTVRVRNLETDVDQGYVISEDAEGPVATDGRYVFWANHIDIDASVLTLEGYDLLTDSRFVVAEYDTVNAEPTGFIADISLSEGTLAWSRWGVNQYQSEVHAASLSDLLPTAYRPDPGFDDPQRSWFSETGHYLGGEFLTYWSENGGLPVFGYPLTEEFQDINADTGLMHTVQFFERQRYEWHPENVGTPYAVLLGRLGAEGAAERRMLDDPAFEPVDPHTSHDNCSYFAETGHMTCGPFNSYWQSHGLEMGDAGITYRESLALFGYPLSEPFTDTNEDGDTVLTQYFERAVFELHPDNPEEHRVLLRRLGAEELRDRGW